jgi:hypothetical protein
MVVYATTGSVVTRAIRNAVHMNATLPVSIWVDKVVSENGLWYVYAPSICRTVMAASDGTYLCHVCLFVPQRKGMD